MRNALVLVPLCIGLTSGFIVPTSTSEAYNSTQSVVTLKQKEIAIDDEMIITNSLNETDNLAHDSAQRELFNEGLEENKIIHERSFILFNKWWKKKSIKDNLADVMVPNSLVKDNANKKSHLDVFQKDPRENIVSVMGGLQMNNFNEKQEYHVGYNEGKNKRIYETTHRIQSRVHSNQGARLQHHSERKVTDIQNPFADLLKTLFVKNSIKNNENIALAEEMKKTYSNQANMKNIIDSNTVNHIKGAYKNKKQNVVMQHVNQYDNIPIYSNKVEEIMNNLDSEIFTEKRLFHLLEDQISYKQTVNKNCNASLNSFKYCQNCVRLAKLSNLNTGVECDCRCGRYIHLRGRINSK